MKKSLQKKMKEKHCDRNEERLHCSQEQGGDISYETVFQHCSIKEDGFGGISVKEVADEFFEETDPLEDVDEDPMNLKDENSPMNVHAELLEQNSYQEEEKFLSSSIEESIPKFSDNSQLPKSFVDEKQLGTEMHLRAETVGEMTRTISLPYESTNENSLVHMRVGNINIYKCTHCSYQTARKGHIVDHLRTHTGEKPFKCNVCPYQSATKGHLKRHSVIHSDEKPFKCSSCSYQTARKGDIQRHLNTHSGEKPFKCDSCPYQSSSKRGVKQHSIIHTGMKPFKCNSCSYETARKEDIVIHSRIHTGEKPFKCSLCPYRATSKRRIGEHSKIHTSEKPFQCSICPYRALTKGNIKRHLQIHTGLQVSTAQNTMIEYASTSSGES